ncbi:hypothetical protein F5X68DRAFT_128012 [Plectosphaerella plurivora]|uniref:Uncharacterized protein n=1 Tax=Plectosphaerella plurivora TaxID=936078 RepID=A0A9P8VM41_9PEZI|nr:hypothetical protein F5X68DRAFT_128012 [Plectosphaerella plurivora]
MHSRTAPSPPSPHGHIFRGLPARRQSFRKLLLKVLSKWLLSAVLTACVYSVFYVYSAKTVLSKAEKRIFNALITGFLIAQALVVVSLMNSVVGDLRWWILARRHRSLAKVEAILQARSLWSVIVMTFKSKRISLHAVALCWVLLALGVQVALASIGLCYSVENAEKYARLVPGRVALPELSTIITSSVATSQSSSSMGARQYTANRFGTVSWAYDTGTHADTPLPGMLWYSDDPMFFCDDATCSYVFRDVNDETQGTRERIFVAAHTSRSVAASTTCQAFPVVFGGDGSERNITIELPDKQIGKILLPARGGLNQTTFFTNTTISCGDGCSVIEAFEADAAHAYYYSCNTTVGTVANATLPAHELGADLRLLASSAIALQGYAAASAGDSSSAPGQGQSTVDLTSQYMVYPAESVFGASMNGSLPDMQYLMSRFAIGVVGVAAMTLSDDAAVDGPTPVLAVHLNMEHAGIIHLILIATCGGLLVLGIAGAWFANKVPVPSEGVVSEAAVLREMCEAHQARSDVAGDLGLATARPEGSVARELWIYRHEYVGNGLYDLHMACSRGVSMKQ